MTTSFVPPGQPFRGDGDADNPRDLDGNGDEDGSQDEDDDRPTAASYRFPDGDDRPALSFGRSAHGRQRRAIVMTIERYYNAARAGDGRGACTLLQPSIARAVVKDDAGNGGPSFLRGAKSCASVLSRLFAHYRIELARPIAVVHVGVDGSIASAVIVSRSLRASKIFAVRVGRSWRLQGLFAVPLP